MTLGLELYNAISFSNGTYSQQLASDDQSILGLSINLSTTESFNQVFYDVLNSLPGTSSDNAYGLAPDSSSLSTGYLNNFNDNTNFEQSSTQNNPSFNNIFLMMPFIGMLFQFLTLFMQGMSSILAQE